MKTLIIALLGLVGFAAPARALVGTFPGNGRMIYDPSDGNVTIDTNGLQFQTFALQDVLGDSVNVFAGAENPTFPPGGTDTVDNDVFVGWVTVDQPFNGVANLGDIAVPGLTFADLVAQLSGTPGNDTYYNRWDAAGNYDFDLTVVPEPGVVASLTLGGVALLRRTRRK